jgi:hypothetical protein
MFNLFISLGEAERSPLTGQLYEVRMMMSVEQSVECLEKGTEVLGEYLP